MVKPSARMVLMVGQTAGAGIAAAALGRPAHGKGQLVGRVLLLLALGAG